MKCDLSKLLSPRSAVGVGGTTLNGEMLFWFGFDPIPHRTNV